jgi:phosphatidylglycerophosphatase A
VIALFSHVGRLGRLLATGLGAGYSPVAPGTAGSAVGVAIFWLMSSQSLAIQASATVVLFFLGVKVAGDLALLSGRKDPGLVVIDEVVGQWIAFLAVPFVPWTAAVGFVLFRVMDVWKPWPARDFERLPGGWGIMADDVMAGIYANGLLRVILLVWPA